MEAKIRHLEMLQAVINRLAHDSFLLKVGSLPLLSAPFVLRAAGGSSLWNYSLFVPVLMFWLLDGYFLWQEKKFRGLYDEVRRRNNGDIDFSMDTKHVKVKSWLWCVFFSPTLIIFHGTLILAALVTYYNFRVQFCYP